MTGYRISGLAEKAGVPATTLRYYEARGLLPARRTAAGYRSYDDGDLERLGFITAAKELGVPLAGIRELLDARRDGPCRDVRHRLLRLVADRATDVDARSRALSGIRHRLTATRARLDAMPERDGPCGPDCAFPADRGAETVRTGGDAAAASRRPPPAGAASARWASPAGDGAVAVAAADPPIACSLPAGGYADRARDWHAALAGIPSGRLADGTVRAEIPHARIPAIAALIAAEAECCPFLTLTLTVTGRGARLDVTAPPDAYALVAGLFPEAHAPVR
ncbi:MerR family transcriptional regulator [Pseudonocardia nematodicida]|uniref:MerR family transcriptional regulator n=1 Tax=Pseudonocardia nematodicida TaxID=1206997 RepID=A0ABV1K9H1_9PSEU